MTDLVTDEMVEIAAIKAAEAEPWMTPWLRLEEFQRRTWRVAERAALTAVAPLIAAQERERCRLIAEAVAHDYEQSDPRHDTAWLISDTIRDSAAIRARSA